LLLTTAATLYFESSEQIGAAVVIMLLVTALLCVLTPGHRAVGAFVARYRRSPLTGLGVVHGRSNLGGGILTAVVGSTFEDKESIRRHIAFCYGLVAALQFTVALLDGDKLTPILWVTLPLAAAAVYLFVVQSLKASRAGYQHPLSPLLVTFGIPLVTR
jgi:peptidoglycan/LPS O-acetylase OafA/YrhL